jgi:putative selenate reductase FAD-binding subunit
MITGIARPKTVQEALRAARAPGAAFLGGGTWLNSGQAQGVTTLVSLEHLGLASIELTGGTCRLGAGVTLQQIVEDGRLPTALRDAAALTASRTLRNMKTIGGDLGRRAPDSAVIPALLALEAKVLIAGRGKPVDLESFLGRASSALILGVMIRSPGRPSAVRALSRTSHSPRSLVVAGAMAGGAGASGEARVILSDCHGQRILVHEQARGQGDLAEDRETLARAVVASFIPAPDIHASSEYKRYIAGVLAADIVRDLGAGRVTP